MRHFQNVNTALVKSCENPVLAAEFVRDPAYTEVQVVPLDAIVIRRDELPEVDSSSGARVNSVGIGWVPNHIAADTAERARSYGLAYLALSEYLREHPPVDDAQVKAITALIDEDEHWGEDGDSSTIARRLVERGVRVETP